MKHVIFGLLAIFAVSAFAQQDHQMKLNQSSTGYSHEVFDFPKGMMVYTLADDFKNKKRVELEYDGSLTMIQIWGINRGGQPKFWNKIMDIANEYKPEGLKTISVNFENGLPVQLHYSRVQEYFTRVTRPENIYVDTMGYTIEDMKVPAFPVYYLVEDGKVFFRTKAEDPEGVRMLEDIIVERLAKRKEASN